MNQYTYSVEIEAAEEGGYVASVPALPGCHTQGESLDETVANIKEAIEGFLLSLVKHGEPIPVERESRHPLTISIGVRSPLAA